MEKKIFDKNGGYTEDGRKILRKFKKEIEGSFYMLVNDGYSSTEVAYMMIEVVTEHRLTHSLESMVQEL